MSENATQVVEAGAVSFEIQYVKTGKDQGPALRVFGKPGGERVELMRFECLADVPNFQYDPGKKREALIIDKSKYKDPIEWTIAYLKGNVASLVQLAGYANLAKKIDEASVLSKLPALERALRSCTDPDIKIINGGGLRFLIEYREAQANRGPSLQVLGQIGEKMTELLRFDCFERAPHFHYDPDGKNNRIFIDEAVGDTVAWTMRYIRGNLKPLISIAGYGDCAERLNEPDFEPLLPRIEAALRESVPSGRRAARA